VTGASETGDFNLHAFLWDGTRMVDLGTGRGEAINASGQVTGFSGGHAFLWDGTAMLDLNAFIPDPLQRFITLEFGVDINDRGQILVNGFDSRTGQNRAYVLSPIVTVPEPGTRALLGLGPLGSGLTRRRAN
jgi:probable HAF family extracellular repeat protein